jgi:asparagine synthetase B (glutamine-hydrolysing)
LEPENASCDGIYSQWKWDGKQLTIENDRYGISPLFYFVCRNEICVSPSLPTLIKRGAPTELDYEALAVFFRLGYFLGESTPFHAIRALPPNVQFTWNKDEVSCVAEYPKIGWSDLSRDQAVDAYVDLFAASIRRRIPEGKNGVLLSGGRDSRHILLELCRQGRAPNLVGTAGIATSDDLEVAQYIAEYFAIPQHWVPQSNPSLVRECRNLYETNFCSFEHSWILNLRDDLIEKVPCVWDGLAGDVLSAGLYMSDTLLGFYRTGSLVELARHLAGGEDKFLKALLRPSQYDLVSNEVALEAIRIELRRHESAPNPIGSYIFWNRTRRVVALSPYALFRQFKVYSPFLDHKLFDLLASIPGETFVNHQFHDDVIARAYSEWAHLPFARKRDPNTSSRLEYGSWFTMLIGMSSWVNPRYFIPRLLWAAHAPGYSRKAMHLIGLPLYLSEIEKLTKHQASVSFDTAVRSERAAIPASISLA